MASGGGNDLRSVYDKYSRFGKTEAQLKEKEIRIESKNIQKLMKDTRVIDTKYPTQLLDIDINRVLGKLTTAGTYVKGCKTFEFQGFKQLIDQIAQSKKVTSEKLIEQITSTSGPSLENVTGTANKSITSRMTDTTQYTGSHKERFDDSGHGKGKEGRAELVKNTGYVGNYKGEGTYDEKH